MGALEEGAGWWAEKRGDAGQLEGAPGVGEALDGSGSSRRGKGRVPDVGGVGPPGAEGDFGGVQGLGVGWGAGAGKGWWKWAAPKSVRIGMQVWDWVRRALQEV